MLFMAQVIAKELKVKISSGAREERERGVELTQNRMSYNCYMVSGNAVILIAIRDASICSLTSRLEKCSCVQRFED